MPTGSTRPTSEPSPLSPNPRQAASYGRRRAGRACAVCRTRKTKCDNQRPVCGFCAATGGECRYPDDESSDHSKLDRGTLAILQRLSDVEHNLATLFTERQQLQQHQPDTTLGYTPASRSEDESGVFTGGSRPTASPPDESHPPSAQIILEGGEINVESVSRWPVFGLSEVPGLVAMLAQNGHVKPAGGESIFDLDDDTVLHLVDNFLSNNHTKNPVFDVNLLWEQVRVFLDRGLAWDGTSCLILLICAVSVLSPPISKESRPGFSKRADRLARGEMFFQAAQRRIGMIYHDNSLLVIQCSFLTAVYLMNTFRLLAAWKTFSQAGTQCVGWLTARGSAVESPSHVEESLYWSCLKSELELRSELGLPGSSLNEMRYPHVYPSPPGMDTPPNRPSPLTTSGESYSDKAREQLERGWFFYLAEIALRRILNDVLSTRYRPGSWYYTTSWWSEDARGGLCSHVAEFRQKAEAWYETLPASMRFTRDPGAPLGDPLRAILRGHLVDILDVLYFPAVKAVATRPVEEISAAVLRVAADGLATGVERVAICREGFWHRHQGTWIMIRTCSRSALQLLAVATRARAMRGAGAGGADVVGGILPERWRESVVAVTELLGYWEDESPDLGVLLARLKYLLERVDG